jgi:hypothetical protein
VARAFAAGAAIRHRAYTTRLEHDPEKLAVFSDKIMRQTTDVDVAHDST